MMIKNNKVIIKNFSYLSLLQFSQLFISFIVFPYLLSTLGKNNYGVIVFAQTVVGYFLLVLNYGFNISVTKDIAINRDDKIKLKEIILTTYYSKIIIFIFITIIFISLITIIPTMNEYFDIYIVSYLSLIGWFIFPEWYFQGVEKMQNITYVMLVSKIISLFFIYFFIKKPEDFYYVPVINTFSIIFSGFLGYFLLIKSIGGLKIHCIPLKKIKASIFSGFTIFFSNITANSKDYFNTFILGFLFNYESVAIYDLASRIIKILILPSSILYKVFFPQISINKSFKTLFKLEKLSFILSVFFIIIILFTPLEYYSLIVKTDTIQFKNILLLLSFSLPLLSLTGSRGMLGLVGLGYEKYFTYGIFFSIFIYFIILLILYNISRLSITNLCITLLISLLVELLSHNFFLKNNLKNV